MRQGLSARTVAVLALVCVWPNVTCGGQAWSDDGFKRANHGSAPASPDCNDHLLYATVATNPSPPITEMSPISAGTLLLVDGQTMRRIGTVDTGSWPIQVVAHPTAPLAYVLDQPARWWADDVPEGRLYVVDGERLEVRAEVAVGFGPTSLAITPDGRRVYVTNWKTNSLSVIDTTRNTVVATIDGIESPVSISAHPDGSVVYVVGQDGNLTVVSVETDEVQERFPVAGAAYSVTVGSDGRFAFVSGDRRSYCASELIVVSTSTGRVTDVFEHPTAGDCVGSFAFTNDGRFGVTSSDDYTGPTILDLQTGDVDYPQCDRRLIDLCDGLEWDLPGSVAIWDAAHRAYVAGRYNLYALDLATRTTVGQISRVDAEGFLLSVAVAPCPAALGARGKTGGDGCNIDTAADRRTPWALLIEAGFFAALVSVAVSRRAHR